MCLGACRGQKRTLDPLELKLQMVVNHYTGIGNGVPCFHRVSSVLRPWTISPALDLIFQLCLLWSSSLPTELSEALRSSSLPTELSKALL